MHSKLSNLKIVTYPNSCIDEEHPENHNCQNLSKWQSNSLLIIEIVALAVVYFVTAKIGQLYAIPPGNVTAIWLPSGIIFVAVLLRGYRIWPGIFLGAFAGNVWSYIDFSSFSTISRSILSGTANGVGDVLCAVLGVYLFRKVVGGKDIFRDKRSVVAFIVFASIFGSFVSAVFGVTSLCMFGFAPKEQYLNILTTWFTGDGVGILVLSPFLLSFFLPKSENAKRSFVECFAFFTVFSIVTLWCLQHSTKISFSHPPIYILIPFFVCSVLRYDRRTTFSLLLLTTALSVITTAKGAGPFFQDATNPSLIELQLFIAASAIMILFLESVNSERKQIKEQLAEHNQRLDDAVKQRTEELQLANKQVKKQNQFLDNVLESLAHPFYVIDANDYTIKLANSAANGDRLPENATCYMVSHHRDTPCEGHEHPCPLLEIKRTRKPVVVEHIHFDKNDKPRNVEVHAFPIFDDQVEVSQIIEYSLDITERKQAEEEVEIQQYYLEKAQKIGAIGTWDMDIANNILLWTEENYKIFGVPLGTELTYESFTKCIHPDDLEYVDNEFKKATEGQPYDIEHRIVDNGQIKWVRERSELLYNDRGEVLRVLGVTQDITERKQVEIKLRDTLSEAQAFRDALDKVPSYVYIKDLQGRYLYCNKSTLDLFECSAEELIGCDDTCFFPPDAVELLRRIDSRVFAGETTEEEIDIVDEKTGRCFYLEVKTPVFEEPGSKKITGLLGISTDITQRKQARDDLQESEQRFHRAVVDSPFPIMIHAEDGEVLQINNVWTEITGYAHDEIPTIFDWTRLAYGKRMDIVKEQIDKIFDCETKVEEGEYQITTKSGQTVTWDFSSAPLGLTPDGRRLVISTAADVTERKQAEECLRTSEERFRAIYENAPVLINAFDENGRCVLWNKECQRVFGWTIEEINTNDDTLSLFYPDPVVRNEVMRTVTNPEGDFRQWHPLTKDGKTLNTMWANFRLPDGITFSLGYDITEQKQAEEQLKVAKEQAEAANLAKSRFLANMSHEIRTPISVIMGFAGLLKGNKTKQEQKGYIKLIQDSSKNLLQVINDVLDVSKVEAGRLHVKLADCNLNDLLSDIESMTKQMAIDKGLKFKVIKKANLPTIINTDYGRLHQCLVNLVTNAIKFTEKGHVHITVSIDKTDNSMIRFDVADTGIGIAPHNLKAVFESFSQIDNSELKQQMGTGLGLTITKRLAELLEGSISVTSKKGKGSVFSLMIPTGIDLNAHTIDEEQYTEGLLDKRQQFVGEVLVAEDYQPLREYAKELLEDLGLKVTTAEHGKMAVEKASDKAFDLILMDMRMPHLDGYGALKELRKKKVATPIVALTAHAMSGFEKACLKQGFDGYLSKPVSHDKLLQILSTHLPSKKEN